jgi:integrase
MNLRRRFARVREAAGLIRLEKVEGKERKLVISTGWAQDCLRHTFASNYLQIYGADKTIKQMGHGDYQMLFGHYRALLTQAQAEAFWQLTPAHIIGRLFSVAA